jgi:hypothetical protein
LKTFTVVLKDTRSFDITATDAYADNGILFLCDESSDTVATFSVDLLAYATSKEVN